MTPDNKKASGIPTRQGVYLRNPSAEKAKTTEAKKASAAPTGKVKDAPIKKASPPTSSAPAMKRSATKPIASHATKTPSRSEAKASTKPIPSKKADTARESGIRKKASAPVHTTAKKTPAEISREKAFRDKENQLKAKLASEMKKTELLKKEARRKKIEKLKGFSFEILKGAIPGLIIASVLVLLIFFAYYRSISRYSQTDAEFSVLFYDYIDMTDTSEQNLEKIELRKKGDERPVLNLDKKTVVRDGAPYVSYSDIADYFNLSVAGDNHSRTVIVGSATTEYTGKNTAEFTVDSSEIRVNGAIHQLSSKPFFQGGELYIPFEFVEIFIKGISVDKRNNKNKTFISVTKTNPEIYFTGSSNYTIEQPDISDYTNGASAQFEYSVDLSKYNKSINPADADKYLTLVNISNKLSEDYVPDDLTNVETSKSRPTQQMRYDAAMALTAFLTAAKAAGYSDLTVSSGYRSYSHQSSLFNQTLAVNLKKYDAATAEAVTAESVMYPGASEHQSGLCADIHNMTTAMQTFANTEQYKWLTEHCADFGFILRYPQTKESVTGVKFEPWHFRFVGRTHAQKIMASGLCLEEYLQTLTAESEG